MRYKDLLSEDGRIVKGVNTTVDVGVGQIPIEARKFGNTVDKDGRPPTLSKRVKGKSTNVLFNLGLSESKQQSCPRTKASSCQCESINKITEAEETLTAVCTLQHGKGAQGTILLKQKANGPTLIVGQITGLKPGEHGFHIHEFGDLSKGCESAGGHYNPDGVDHGDLKQGHVGDLGNVTADDSGVANIKIVAERVDLVGERSVVGRAIVIHSDVDDLGKGGDAESLKTGNAGDRLACGVITLKETVNEKWSAKYKRSINCSNPKGFSQKAHCAGRKKNESVTKQDLNAPTPTIQMLARKWKTSPKEILTQVKKGVKVEAEHTTDFDIAMEIALDHINEDPKYYDKLKFVEAEDSLGEIASSSQIYVDMDGVLADFFGEWAKLMDVEHFTQINKKHDINDALQKIRDTDDFWLRLPMLPEAKNLLNLIKQVKGSYNICSSPLADDPNSEKHKRTWVEQNLSFFPPDNVYITHDKPQYATNKDGTPNILIDDYGVNIRKWEAAGGIGFKYKDHKFERTADAIKQHMQEPVESYTREQLPQLRQQNLKNIRHTIERVSVEDLIPVQEERILENFKRQVDRIVAGKYNPIIVDCNNKIINGHHRYEAVKMMGYNEVEVAKLPFTIKQIVENFADGKKNEARTPRMNPADVTAATIASSKPVSQEELQRIVNDYKSKPPSAIANLVNKVDVATVINIAMMIGAPHLTFIQKFLVKKGIKFSQKQMQKAMAQVESIEENFADGKVKGKSRPGRVKRSGASCNGSVTDLRKRAKNASGEKAKMYHWCANMKSGRKKK